MKSSIRKQQSRSSPPRFLYYIFKKHITLQENNLLISIYHEVGRERENKCKGPWAMWGS